MRANKNRPAGSAATVMSDVTTPPSATGAVQVVPSYLRQSTAAPVVRVKTETVPDGDAIAAPTGANTAALGGWTMQSEVCCAVALSTALAVVHDGSDV